MNEVKVTVTPNEKGELIIRTGSAEKAIDLTSVEISGNINCPADYLSKRGAEIAKNSHITVDHEKGIIVIRENENSPIGSVITGTLELHPNFDKWGINKGKVYSSLDLAQMVKMNRFMFPSTQEAMTLVGVFQNLKVKVEKEIELSDDKRGNTTSKRVQAVQNMSIPEGFTIKCPLFKGFDPVEISVEISINAESLEIQLVSPGANDMIESTRESIISDQVKEISTTVPAIPIIHK